MKLKSTLILLIALVVCIACSKESANPKEKGTIYYIKFKAGGVQYAVNNVNDTTSSNWGSVTFSTLLNTHTAAAHYTSNSTSFSALSLGLTTSEPLQVKKYENLSTENLPNGNINFNNNYSSSSNTVIEVVEKTNDYTKFRFSGRLKKHNTTDQFLDITEGELVFKNFTFGK
jgi:hypothetical protein